MVSSFLTLHDGSPAELARAKDQRALEQSPLLEISQKTGDRLVHCVRVPLVILGALGVSVPVGTDQLYKPNTSFHHASREQTHLTEPLADLVIQSIHPSDVFRFLGNTHQFGGRRLHAKSQFVIRDAGRQARVVGTALQVSLVPLLDTVENSALLVPRDLLRQT